MRTAINHLSILVSAFVCITQSAPIARAGDWPQWMGPDRDGVWRESGIVAKLPTNGPVVLWRSRVNHGYCGPAVVGSRLFRVDRLQGTPPERNPGERALPVIPGNERVLCLDRDIGSGSWEHTYDGADRISHPFGPRATPIVADGRVSAGSAPSLRVLKGILFPGPFKFQNIRAPLVAGHFCARGRAHST